MKRNQWILIALVLFLGAEIGHYIWAHWGLITVHSKGQPLSQVIRSIEKQGHVTIKTNVDVTKPVKMWLTDVSLAEAMETLATVTETRWRLTYIVGPDKGSLALALAGVAAGQRTEGWKSYFVPFQPMMLGQEEPDILPDPRKDTWAVKPATEQTLQAYLTQASRNVSASFLAPESWNPPVKSPPAAGAINKALPKLVSEAKGQYQEVFLLQQREQRERRAGDRGEREAGDDGPRFAGNFGRGGFDAMEERMRNEIAKLPPDQRSAAELEIETRKKIREEMKDLTPEQRRKRFEDLMNTPDAQNRMDSAANKRDSRMSPSQRTANAGNYLSKAASAKAAASGQ